MEKLTNLTWPLRIWNDSRGQDLVEYALLAGFLAMTAAAMVGSVAENVSPMFSKVVSVMGIAADAGQATDQPPAGGVSAK